MDEKIDLVFDPDNERAAAYVRATGDLPAEGREIAVEEVLAAW